MAITRIQSFGSDLRRMRDRVTSAFVQDAGAPRPPATGRRAPLPPSLTIRDIMEQDLATVMPEAPVRHAVQLMIAHQISSVPVVDTEGCIAGALNEGDLMQVFYQPGALCVADVMTREPIVLAVDAPFVDVIDHLMSSNFRRVLIHEERRLVGVITRSHVMPALLAALEHRVGEGTTH